MEVGRWKIFVVPAVTRAVAAVWSVVRVPEVTFPPLS
jgi:hypothetical protein